MRLLLACLAAAAMMCSCDTSPTNTVTPSNTQTTPLASTPNPLDSVNQLDDPYTVENMRAALKALKAESKSTAARTLDEEEIAANYLYVRFLPVGKKEKGRLRTYMKDIPIFDHPLDYELENRWETWVDSTLPDSTYAYYAAVPADFEFPDSIAYEKIKSVFLVQPILAAEDDSTLAGRQQSKAVTVIAATFKAAGVGLVDLEMKSRELTIGNPKEVVAARKAGMFSKWRPSGRITYDDDKHGVKPVKGVRVTAGYSYYWRSSEINEDGRFLSPERWYYSCEYELHWDTNDFLMENGLSSYGADLMIQGPTNYQPWNKHLSGVDAKHAAIFAGAWNYYYGDIDGLARPRMNGLLSVSMDIQVSDESSGSDIAGLHNHAFVVEWIDIYLKRKDETYYSSDILYAVTTHELAHQAHYTHFPTRKFWYARVAEFDGMSSVMKESWARGVEIYLTRKVYPNYRNGYDGVYTGIIEDLMDTDITRAHAWTDYGGQEFLSGFSIKQLQDEAFSSFNMGEFKNRISAFATQPEPWWWQNETHQLFGYWARVPKEDYR